MKEPVVVAASNTKQFTTMKDIKGYEAPQVEIIEVEVEKGFAVSDLVAPQTGIPGQGA